MIKDVTLGNIIGNTGIFHDGDWVESKDQDPNGEVRLIQLADIGDGEFLNKSNRYLTYKRAEELKCTFLKAGDVLIARMPDPIGRACIFPEMNMPCITVVDICIVRPDPKLANKGWIKLLLNSVGFRQDINQYITGTTRKRISRGNLSKIKFTLPSIENQQRIASVLNKAQALIKQREESISLAGEFLKYKFLEMFNTLLEGSKEKLGKHLDIQQGYAFKSKDFQENGIPVIKIGTVNKGFFDIETLSFLPERFLKSTKRFDILPGDLLISMTGTVGKDDYANTCFVTNAYKQYLLNQRVGKLIPDGIGLNITFVHYLFQLPEIKGQLIKANRGVRQANLSNNDILNLEINYPPIEMQKQFALIVMEVEKLKSFYKESFDDLKELFESLNKKAFKGELDVIKESIEGTLDIIDGEKKTKGSLVPPEVDEGVVEAFEPIEIKEKYVLIEKRLTVPLLKKFILAKFGNSNFSFARLMKDLNEESYKTDYFQIRELVFFIIKDNFLIQDFHNPEDGDKEIFISNDTETPVEDQTFRIFLKVNEAY